MSAFTVTPPADVGGIKTLVGPQGEVLRRFASPGAGVSSFAATRTGGAGVGAFNATRISGTELMRFAPSLASADGDILPDKRALDAQARDQVRNDGYLSGARQVHVDNVVGHQFRLNAKPNWRLLVRINPALDEAWAEEFAATAEARFNSWAEDETNNWPDAQRMQNFTGLVRMVAMQLFDVGEFIATAEWLNRGPYRTALQVIDPDRLCNPIGEIDGPNLRRGVILGKRGEPTAYTFRVTHPDDNIIGFNTNSSFITKVIPRFRPWGRLQVIHLFNRERPDQNRGVSRMVAVLRNIDTTRRYSDLVLQNMAVGAMYAATLESDLDRDTAMSMIDVDNADGTASQMNYYDWMMGQVATYSDNSRLRIDGVKVPYLPIGTSLKMNTPAHGGGIGADFEDSLIRKIAAGIGMSKERFMRDWSKTNYSSSRAGALEDWKYFLAVRRFGPHRFASIVYQLVLEEMWYRNELPLPNNVPDFWEMPAAYAACTWRGAGRGQIDPVKETNASIMKRDAGLSTLEREVSELNGEDWRDVLDQRAREQRYADDKGISLVTSSVSIGANAAKDIQQDPSNPNDPNNATGSNSGDPNAAGLATQTRMSPITPSGKPRVRVVGGAGVTA